MSRWSRIAALAVALTVAACAALVRDSGPPRAPEPFDLSGRVVVSYDGRAFSSALRWQHLPERDEIWLLTPLGQALAHIVSAAEGATFTGADRKQYHGAGVEGLTRQALGWELPLTRLQYWVHGEVAPGSTPEGVERDAEGRLTGLVQDDWHISIARYPTDEHGGLPRRLELRRGANQTIRLVIDAWRREPPAS
jgi:outer membrane lipoprotein LolB